MQFSNRDITLLKIKGGRSIYPIVTNERIKGMSRTNIDENPLLELMNNELSQFTAGTKDNIRFKGITIPMGTLIF